MSLPSEPTEEKLRQTVEVYWETFPPFWRRIRAYIRKVATEQFDISVEQFHVLRHIRHGYGSVSELAEARNISRPAISQAVEVLVQKGLVARSTDGRDRRYIKLALTDSGNDLLDTIFDNVRHWMMDVLSSLSEKEMDTLIQGMDVLRKIQTG